MLKKYALCRYRDGERVNVTEPGRYSGGNTDQHSLIINNASGADLGLYTCHLRNAVGRSASDGAISVDVLCECSAVTTALPTAPCHSTDPRSLQSGRWCDCC